MLRGESVNFSPAGPRPSVEASIKEEIKSMRVTKTDDLCRGMYFIVTITVARSITMGPLTGDNPSLLSYCYDNLALAEIERHWKQTVLGNDPLRLKMLISRKVFALTLHNPNTGKWQIYRTRFGVNIVSSP